MNESRAIYAGDQASHRKPQTRPQRADRICVDGESVTYAQIAERTGRTARNANARVQLARKSGQPLTWKGIGKIG